MTESVIEIHDLHKRYQSTQALKGISLEVPRGQVLGFLGPNGAGKSTTMKILTGYIAQSSGSAKVCGIEVADDRVAARSKIGYLSESNPLYDDMMVAEYLSYCANVRGFTGHDADEKLKSAASRCGIASRLGHDIRSLSKGLRQRVGLAQAILGDPELLILDEPTTGLDPNQVIEIRNLIMELGQEKTVLMSTHIMPEVQATCSRVVIIAEGQIVADAAPDKLLHEGSTIDLEVISSAEANSKTKLTTAIQKLSGIVGVQERQVAADQSWAFKIDVEGGDPRRELAHLLMEHRFPVLKLEQESISLEETFRKLTMTDMSNIENLEVNAGERNQDANTQKANEVNA